MAGVPDVAAAIQLCWVGANWCLLAARVIRCPAGVISALLLLAERMTGEGH